MVNRERRSARAQVLCVTLAARPLPFCLQWRLFIMKRTIMAAMVLSLAAGSLAFADPPHDHDRDHHEDRHQMVEHHSMRDEHEHRGFMMSGRYVRPHG